jgi:hypothetical protein
VDVPRPTTEVTPILGPQRKATPKSISIGGNATIRASIDAEALDISGDDDDDDDDSGDDGPTINMMRKVEGGRRA